MFFNYLFEISWEVCNKVGGINTVIASKINPAKENFDNYFLMGPYNENSIKEIEPVEFSEFADACSELEGMGIKLHFGRWKNYEANIILVEYLGYCENINDIKGKLWDMHKIDSLNSEWFDFDEAALWSWCCGIAIDKLTNNSNEKCLVHAHEWMSGGSVFYLKSLNYEKFKTVFTTHATMLGRALSGNGFNIYKNNLDFDPDTKAYEIGVHTKHQCEKALAHASDAFTTVSDITGKEAEHFYEKKPDNILYNGFNTYVSLGFDEVHEKSLESRKDLNEFIKGYFFNAYDVNPQDNKIIYTSGRNEFVNKGVDIYIDALAELNKKLIEENSDREVFNLFLIPIGNFEKDQLIIESINKYNKGEMEERFEAVAPLSTHKMDISNDIINRFLTNSLSNKKEDRVKVILIPKYLDESDEIFNKNYYDVIKGCDLGVFPSYYEPWGYTPLESLAYAVPTVTSDLSGFGRYLKSNDLDSECVEILGREGKSHEEIVDELKDYLKAFVDKDNDSLIEMKKKSRELSVKFDWEKFYDKYLEVYEKLIR